MKRSGQVEERPSSSAARPAPGPSDLHGRRVASAASPVQTVIVPVDGSPLAERAIGVGADLAAAFRADLRLFKASFKLDVRDEVDQLRSLADRHGLPRAQVEVSTGRSAAPAVILASRRATDSLVVMATHGRSGLGATLLGSVAGEVLNDLDAPMVLVGPGCTEHGIVSTIVVCWDGSLTSASVVPTAGAWAATLALPVRLVHMRGSGDAPLLTDSGGNADETVRQVMAGLSVAGHPPEIVEILDGDPADGLLSFCRSLPPGTLLALATKGRGGLLSSPLGRVASRIVRESPHPVLISHLRS